jgi:hypothetical protein
MPDADYADADAMPDAERCRHDAYTLMPDADADAMPRCQMLMLPLAAAGFPPLRRCRCSMPMLMLSDAMPMPMLTLTDADAR